MSLIWRLSTLHPDTLNTPPALIRNDSVPTADDVVTATGIAGTSNRQLTQVTNTFYLLTFQDALGIPCVLALIQQDVFDPYPNTTIHSAVVSQ